MKIKPLLETEAFTIWKSPFDPSKLLITRKDGEGTEITPEEFDEWLEKMFNEVV